jgi:putative two-component system response regulator
LLGLIDVMSGAVESGLAAVEEALSFAKKADGANVPVYLSNCIDAYEAAGHLDKALLYLRELVEWKRKSTEVGISPLQQASLGESMQFQNPTERADERLLAKSRSLQTAVRSRIELLVESAINSELASGHDLYRTFRLAKLARGLALANGWDESRIGSLALGAQLCNIGMMAMPTRVLQKPGGLSEGERRVLRDHTRYGAELLRNSKLSKLDMASVIAEQHHERFDGDGYPHGLSGATISEEARIVSLCDAFDAMTHPRPWRRTPMSIPAALREVERCAGRQFDPALVTPFVELVRSEFREHDDFDAFLAEGADEFEYVRARARMEAFLDAPAVNTSNER